MRQNSYVPAAPMIISSKVLKYFLSGKISFFLFASLSEQDLKLKKSMFFFQKSQPTEQ